MAEFVKAALPWVLLGLGVAVVCAMMANRKKKPDASDNHMVIGMAIGMCFGVAFGSVSSFGLGVTIPLGMLWGMAFGMCFQKKDSNREDDDDCVDEDD